MNWLRRFGMELKLCIIHIKQLMQFHWMHYFSEDPQLFILSKNLPFRDTLLEQTVQFIWGFLSGSTTERVKIAKHAKIVKQAMIFNGKKYEDDASNNSWKEYLSVKKHGKRPKRTDA